jgi:hypothetical protein
MTEVINNHLSMYLGKRSEYKLAIKGRIIAAVTSFMRLDKFGIVNMYFSHNSCGGMRACLLYLLS